MQGLILDDMAKKIYHMWEKYKYYTENIRSCKNLIEKGKTLL